MAKSNEISIALIVLLVMSGAGFGQYDENSVSRCFKKVKEILPDNWEVIQIDGQPPVSVEGWDGYRFLLRASRKEYLNVGQQAMPVADPNAYDDYEYVMKYSHIDLVLFLDDAQLGENSLQNLTWEELEQEYYVQPVYMGTGDGFHWFGNMSLYWQEMIRDKISLNGGESRIKLLINGLSIKDSGDMTRNSATHLLANHGDEAIPYLQEIIKEGDYNSQQTAFRVFGYIRTDRVTELLREYYALKKTRELAAYALIHQPYRPDAKDEYIDMLKRRIRIFRALDACVEFNSTEALTNIEKLCNKPGNWRVFFHAYLAKRTLQGNPVSEEMTEAYIVLKGPSEPDEIEQAKAVILADSDKEAATVMALNLIFLRGKIPRERLEYFVKTGFEILSALPEGTTKPLIEHLLDSLDEELPGTAKWLSPIDQLRQFYEID